MEENIYKINKGKVKVTTPNDEEIEKCAAIMLADLMKVILEYGIDTVNQAAIIINQKFINQEKEKN